MSLLHTDLILVRSQLLFEVIHYKYTMCMHTLSIINKLVNLRQKHIV